MEQKTLKTSALEGPFDCTPLCGIPTVFQFQLDTPMLGDALQVNTSCHFGEAKNRVRVRLIRLG